MTSELCWIRREQKDGRQKNYKIRNKRRNIVEPPYRKRKVSKVVNDRYCSLSDLVQLHNVGLGSGTFLTCRCGALQGCPGLVTFVWSVFLCHVYPVLSFAPTNASPGWLVVWAPVVTQVGPPDSNLEAKPLQLCLSMEPHGDRGRGNSVLRL